MRIYNKQDHQVFFSYAGTGRRGVWLEPDKRSPELPPARLSNPALQNALKCGAIGVLLSPADKVAARGVVPDEILELAVGAGASTKAFDIKKEKERQAAEEAKAAAEKEAAEEAEEKEADEREAAEAAAAEEAAAEQRRRVKEAAEEAIAEEEAEEAKAAAEKEAAEAETAKVESEAKEDAVAEKAKQYRKMKKTELLDLCLQRGLAADPGMKVGKLRKMLTVNDKVFG